MKCKPNCAPGGTLSKTRLASCSGGILAGSTDECWRAGSIWPDTRQDPPARDIQHTRRDPLASYSGILSGILGGIHGLLWWDTSRSAGELLWRDTRRDPLAGCSGEILGGIHLAGYRAGSTGEQLSRDTRRDPLASCSGGIVGGIRWRAALAGYSAGCTWRDTGRDPLASSSGGIHWRAALAGYWVRAWCRSIPNADSSIKSNNPFLSGGEKT